MTFGTPSMFGARAGLGRMSCSSDVVRFVQDAAVNTSSCAALLEKLVMDAQPVESRDALIRHIHAMVDDYAQCENRDVETFLNAMAAWLNDCGGYYRNTGQAVNIDEPSWQLFADALSAATVYD